MVAEGREGGRGGGGRRAEDGRAEPSEHSWWTDRQREEGRQKTERRLTDRQTDSQPESQTDNHRVTGSQAYRLTPPLTDSDSAKELKARNGPFLARRDSLIPVASFFRYQDQWMMDRPMRCQTEMFTKESASRPSEEHRLNNEQPEPPRLASRALR